MIIKIVSLREQIKTRIVSRLTFFSKSSPITTPRHRSSSSSHSSPILSAQKIHSLMAKVADPKFSEVGSEFSPATSCFAMRPLVSLHLHLRELRLSPACSELQTRPGHVLRPGCSTHKYNCKIASNNNKETRWTELSKKKTPSGPLDWKRTDCETLLNGAPLRLHRKAFLQTV